MDPLYLQDPIKPAATPQAAKGLRDAINNDSPMMSGFVSGTYGYGGSSLLGLANLAEVVGADSVGQGLRKKAASLFDTAQKFTPSAMSLDSVKDFGSGVDYVRANAGQGLGSMLPVIAGGAAGLAPGLAAATAPMYGENIGRLEQDPTLAGTSAGQKALYAAPTAAVQGALNYVVPGGFAAAAGRQIASRTGTGALGKAGVTLGTVGLVEGATEGGEELVRQGMHTLANPERDTSGDNKQLLESFVGGMVGGSPIGAVQAGAGYVQDRMVEREQDTRTLSQKAGDAIADAGGALGRRQGERDAEAANAEAANAALDAIQREAQERGVPPRDIINERIQRLNTPVDLSDAFTEAEATQRVMQDEEGKRATADELVQSILNDPDAAPEMRRAAEEHVAAVQAGATNKYEETGMKLGEAERKRAGVMGLVDTIAKAIEPVAGKPAPAKRGSAMTPKKFGDIEYEGPASDTRPAGEDAFSYTEFSGVPANKSLAQQGSEGRYGPEQDPFEPRSERRVVFDERNRIEFYKTLFDQLDQQAAQTGRQSPATPEVRRAVAQPPAQNTSEAAVRERLIGKFAVDLRSWLPEQVGKDLDIMSEALMPRNEFERRARQMWMVRQDNPVRALGMDDWRKLDRALKSYVDGNGDKNTRAVIDELFGGSEVTQRVLMMYTPGSSAVNTQQYDPDGGRTGADRTVMQEDESFVEYGEAEQEVGTQERWVGENTTGFVPAFEQQRLKETEDRIQAHSKRIEELRAVQNPNDEQKKEIQELTYSIVRAKDAPKARKYYDKNDENQRQSLGRAKEALLRDGGDGATVDEVGLVDREIAARKLTDPEDIKRAQLEIVNDLFPGQALGYSPENDTNPSRRALFEKELSELVRAANTRFKALRGERASFTADSLEFTDRDVSDIQFRLGKEKLNNQKYGVARGTIAFEVPGRVDPLVTSAPKLIAKMLSKRERESVEKHQGAVDENFQLLTQAITSVLSKLGEGAKFGYVVTTATPQGVEGEVVVMDGQRDEFPADFKLRDLKQGDKKKTITYGDVVQSRSNKDRDYSAGLARRANQAVDELLNSEAVSDVSAMAVIEFHAENPKDSVNNAHIIALHRKFVGGQFENPSEQNVRVSRVEAHDMKRELNLVRKRVAGEIARSNLPKERYAQLYAARDEINAALAEDSSSLEKAYRKYVLAVKDGGSGAVFRHTDPWSNKKDTSRELLRDSDYRKFLTDLRDKTNRAKVVEINRRLEETENEVLRKKLALYRAKLIAQNREITRALNGASDLRDTYLALNPEKTVREDDWGTVPSENEATSDDSGAPLGRGSNEYDPVGENAPMYRDDSGLASGSEAAYFMTGRAQSGPPRQLKADERVVDMGVVTEDVDVPRMRELRDSKDLPVGMLPVVDDFGNVATEKESRFVGRMTRPAKPGEMNRQADTVPSRGEDNMAPNTTALPENARALYKTESPAEWVVGVLAPRNGVDAAAKAWRTVKNATTDKMKKSRDLMARALHSISSMKPEDFRLTFNKELTAQQAQTMINRAKSVIDQEKVPDDRPGAVGRSATATDLKQRLAVARKVEFGELDDNASAFLKDYLSTAKWVDDTTDLREEKYALREKKTRTEAEERRLDEVEDMLQLSLVRSSPNENYADVYRDYVEELRDIGNEYPVRSAQIMKILDGLDELARRAVTGNPSSTKQLTKRSDTNAQYSQQTPAGWGRFATGPDMMYEVSSQGDKRFSALNARLKDGRTIEEAYQLDVKGYRKNGNDWRLGKGRPPLTKMSREQVWNEYKGLWEQWASENPQLMADLRKRSAGKTLTDRFATTDVSQARALFEILSDGASKPNAQFPQTPGEATTDAKRTAELKAALAEVKRLLGKDFDAQVSNELFDPVSGVAWSGEFDPQQMRILIAAGATDTMGPGRHEALHALFKMLRDMGHPEAVKVIENLAKNPAVMSQLKKHLADHKNALEQLNDPEEAAAYAFQFWMAGQLKLGPQAKTFFQKVMDFLNKAQLALRDKVFGSEVAKTERARLKQDALALELLGAFRDGAMASPEGRVSVQAVLEANKQALEARRLNTRAFGHKFHKFLQQGAYSSASVFEDSANPHVKALGKMFFRMEGDARGEKQNFLEAAAQANDRYQVKVRNILVKLDKDTAELVSKYMNNRTELKDIHHPEAHEAVKALRDLLDDLLLYQRNMNTARWDAEKMEWVAMGEVEKNYYPRVWSINVLTEKQGEFIEKMSKALEKYRRDFKGFPEIEEFNADTMAKAILNKLINGAGSNDIEEMTSDVGITPWQASVNKRALNWLDDVAPGEFTEYFSNDVAEVMTSYVSQATKRAEYNHAFGRGGEKIREAMFKALVYEMGGESLVESAQHDLRDAVKDWLKKDPETRGEKPTVLGVARLILEERIRQDAYGENRAELKKLEPKALEKALDKLTTGKVEERQKEAAERLDPVTKAIMAMEGTLGREIDPTLRHVMSGVTTFQNFRLLPLALFASINDVVGIVARGGTMKDAFQAFTRGIKEVGLMWKGEYSQDELAKLAERLGTVGGGNYLDAMGQTYSSQFMYGKLRRWNDALFKWNGLEAWNRAVRIQATGAAIEFIKRHVEKPNEHSKRYLEELFGEGYDTSLIMKDGDLDYSNDRVREAVLTWVNGAVLRPNASHRPIYASDPHYMLFYHLKQFAYSFHKVILRRAWIEAKEGNYTPAAALFTGYVPVSIAADVVKELLIMGDDDPWWTKGGLTAYLEHGIARANLGGVPQMWLGDIADPVMAFKDPGRYIGGLSNVAGPAPDQLIDLISVPFLEDKTLVKEAAGGVPGGVLIRRYVD